MSTHIGRHRASGYSPLAELAQIATDNVKPVARVSAAAVMTGGLVATMAMPASALTLPESALPSTESADGAVIAEVGPSLSAPASAPGNETFGSLGFTTKKVTAASRSNDRAALTATSTASTAAPAAAAKTTAAPKAEVNVPPSDGTIVGIARSLSGIRYVHGGSSPSAGFDCSGFTSYVYRQVGKSIARTAEGQRAGATKVSNPQPGDLVFFGYPAYHVGIYAGPGMLYDARRPGILSGLHTIWTTNKVSYGRF